MIRKGLQIGDHDCHNAGLDKLRASGPWHGARAGQISKVDLVLPSGPTGMPLQTSFFRLLSMGTKMVGPGASQLVLYLATVALVDGASVFIASDTGAVTVSPLGGVALVCPVIFSVVALDSEEPIEDLLFPNLGSRAMSPATWRSVLMKELWRLPTGVRWSESRRAARRWPFLLDRVTESPCWHLDRVCPWIRQPIWHTGAKCPSLWASAPFWTWPRPSL